MHGLSAAGELRRELHDGRVRLFHRPFSELSNVLSEQATGPVDGLLADLGVSSYQLDDGARGFSFRTDAPLDMRMDTSTGETARELLARLDEEELANVIYTYGEDHKSRRIAWAIKKAPTVPETTGELAAIVARALGGHRGRIHPATKTFQALRIAVNGELDELDSLLKQLHDVVKPGGRAAIISFHSLEDRRVKVFFKAGGWKPLTKRPVVASEEEQSRNPRSRSAKLRVAVRVQAVPDEDEDAEHDDAEHDDDEHDDGGADDGVAADRTARAGAGVSL